MKKAKKRVRRQYAALPYRRTAEQAIEVMLITSRETKRWIIPKGWPVKGLKPREAAAREAREEAGLVGRIGKRAIGSFRYEKQTPKEQAITCDVDVFLLQVKEQLDEWPEKDEREAAWFDPGDAAGLVAEEALGRLLSNLPTYLAEKETEA